MKRSEIKRCLNEKVERQRSFFANKEPGGLLLYVGYAPVVADDGDSDDLMNKAGLAGSIYRAVIAEGSILMKPLWMIPVLLRVTTKSIGKTILFDALLSEQLTAHEQDVSPDKLLEIFVRKFAGYHVEQDEDYRDK